MTVVVDDPLIAGMAIDRMLPLHESSRRLRELYPECPRVYGVAVMADVSRRRWWPLIGTDRRSPQGHVRRLRQRDGQPGRRNPAAGSDPGARRDRPSGRAGRAGRTRLGHRAGEPLGARRLRRRHRLAGRGRPDACGCCPTIPVSAPTAWCGCPARRRWRPGSRIAATARWSRCSAGCTKSVAARSASPRCGTRSGPRSWWPPPRCPCWPAPARSPACGAARPCSTPWSASACRCAGRLVPFSPRRGDGTAICGRDVTWWAVRRPDAQPSVPAVSRVVLEGSARR